jgi:hypothetical protein
MADDRQVDREKKVNLEAETRKQATSSESFASGERKQTKEAEERWLRQVIEGSAATLDPKRAQELARHLSQRSAFRFQLDRLGRLLVGREVVARTPSAVAHGAVAPSTTRWAGSAETQGSPVSERALAESPIEAILALRTLLRGGASRESLAAVVAPTVEKLEANPRNTIETVDFVVQVLRHPPRDLDLVDTLTPYVRGFLSRAELLTSDALKTLGSLGDLYAGQSKPERSLRAIAFYSDALDQLRAHWLASPPESVQAVDPDYWQVLEADANNIAVHLSRNQQSDAESTLIARLARLATLGSVHRADAIPREALPDGSAWTRYLAAVGGSWPTLLNTLSKESRIGEVPGVASAYAHALAGVAHAILRQEDRAAAGFFNAGVALIRLRRRAKPIVAARILLNISGLYWALELNPRLEDALNSGDGSDCAVNLFGALTEWKKLQGTDLSPDWRRLASQLLGARGLVEEADLFRLQNSWNELEFDLESSRPPSPTEDAMRQSVLSCSRALDAAVGFSVPRLEGDTRALAERVEAIFASLANEPDASPEALRQPILATLSEMGRAVADPVGTFVREWGEIQDAGGPAVLAGRVTPDGWQRVKGDSQKPVTALAPIVRAALNKQPIVAET